MRVFLTGRVSMVTAKGSFDESDLPGTQGRLAFASLVLERSPKAREELADRVWDGEQLPDSWNTALDSLISKIRRLLSQIGLDGKEVLLQTAGSYQLVLPAGSWVDIEDATRRLDRAEGARRHGEMEQAVSEATVAAGIFRRPFLAGVGGHWAEAMRNRHRDALYRSYEVLTEGWRRNRDPGLAATVAQSAIDVNPFRESAYRLLMQAEAARGDRAAALLAYRRRCKMLRDELDTVPSPETEAVNREILAG